MVSKIKDIKLNMGLSLSDVIAAVKELKPGDKEIFIESLIAATSPEYLQSITTARKENKAGKVFEFDEVFKKN